MKWNGFYVAVAMIIGLAILFFLSLDSETAKTVISKPSSADHCQSSESGGLKLGSGDKLSIPGAALCLQIMDAYGQPVKEGKIEVVVTFEGENAYYDYDYDVDLARWDHSNGLLGMQPPPDRTPATIKIRVITPDGNMSETIQFSNTAFWQAVEKTKRRYVASYTFHLGNNDQTVDLIFEP